MPQFNTKQLAGAVLFDVARLSLQHGNCNYRKEIDVINVTSLNWA